MNWLAIKSIYTSEMKRFFRTLSQSILSPVLSTVLYFVVFGAAIGGRIQEVGGIPYGAFIVPNSPALFSSCSPRRFPLWKFSSAMLGPQPAKRF